MKKFTLFASGFVLLATLVFAKENSADTKAKEAAASEAVEGMVTLREIFNHRAQWPREIKFTKAVEGAPFAVGDRLRLVGVTSAGVKVVGEKGRAIVPHESTTLLEAIESKLGKPLARVVPEPEPEPGAAGVVSASQERALPGDELVHADGSKFDKSSLGGKFVGVYFSAKWCPPCRGFTPTLVKFRDTNSDEFEVIFVSSDRTKDAMFDYMKSYKMGFAATEFGSKMHKELAKKYAARGIPHLVIFSPDGRVVSRNGRGDISGKGEKALADWKQAAED